MAEQQQHQSSDAIRFEKQKENGGDEEDENDDGEEEKQQRSEFQPRELSPELETLEVDSTAQSGHYAGFGVNSEAQAQFQKQNGTSHQEILASVSSQPAQGQMQNLQQLVSYPTALSELSPTSVTQSISPAPSPILPEQRQSLQKVNSSCMPEEDKQNFHRSILPVPLVKTSASDGYNWRKYGQKQVKSPPGSRSYYRCSSTECSVKKIECCDHSGHTIGIVYKSQHTHEPPWRSNTREIKVATSAECVGNSIIESPCGILNDSELSTISKEPIQESSIPERKRQNSSDSDGNGDAMIKEDHEPESKRRLKKSNLECSNPLLKPSKKVKFVVHAAGDVGVSGDGYRWRKYGQKMVKGNPHPRNYYRCTSAGCPVRKHIETAGDNTNALIIAYKDIHDHDMPVPKKRHGPPSAALVAAAAPVAMSNLQIVRTDTDNQISSTQWSVDRGGELTGETLELGGEKAMESARTLLSIGFEIKPC